MNIRLDNLTSFQKYICSFDTQKAPRIISSKFNPSFRPYCGTFVKNENQTTSINKAFPYNYDKLYNLSNYLHKKSEKSFEIYKDIFEKAFADILQNGGEIKGRVKSAKSILNKLIRRNVNYLSQIEQVYKKVPDICGYKLITNGTFEDMEKIVKQIEKLIENDTFTPVSIINRGKNSYLNNSQIAQLAKKGFKVTNAATDGLNNVNILLKDKNGKMLELQIMGKETEKLYVKEHPFYKFKQQPMFATATDDDGKLIDDLTLKFALLKDTQLLEEYSNYINECYSYARNLELGISAKKPVLSENIKKIFDYADKILSSRGAKVTSVTEFY